MPSSPPPQGHYQLILDTTPAAYFQECRDLGTKTEVLEYRQTASNGSVMILTKIGQTTSYNIVLTRIVIQDLVLAKWRRQIEGGDLSAIKKTGAIVSFDDTGREVARWTFTNGWPSKLKTDIPAGTEELTLAVDTLSRA